MDFAGNPSISANADFEYVVVSADGRKFVVAKELLGTVKEAIGWESVEILKELKGSELEHMKVQHPFYDRESFWSW